jgi:succinyl-diaminopimelate desuccinylase
VQTEEAPTYGIAPDSGWPLYHAEKGIMNLEITVPLNKGGEMELVEVSGGQRPNIVIDSCSAKVRVAASARKEVEEKLADAWDRNVTFAWEGDVLGVYAIGKAAHGSRPFDGDSAAIRVFRFLRDISPLSSRTYFDEVFDTTHIGGAGIGISGTDEPSGDLTCNLGIVSTENDAVELLYNIRYPVTWTGASVHDRCQARLDTLTSGFTLRPTRDSPPLYFPLDHPLVKTIVDVYEAETGERRQPGTMGGGTYARAVPNTVSVGTGWEGDGAAHETDERVKVDHLFKMSRIYAHILYRLATMA